MNIISAGVFFYSNDNKRYLYLLRTDSKHSPNWGIPGGKIESDETLLEGIERECLEEIGYFPERAKLVPIQKFVNNSFVYHTFCLVIYKMVYASHLFMPLSVNNLYSR